MKVIVLDIYIDGLVQDCSNSSALAMELLQSYIDIFRLFGVELFQADSDCVIRI